MGGLSLNVAKALTNVCCAFVAVFTVASCAVHTPKPVPQFDGLSVSPVQVNRINRDIVVANFVARNLNDAEMCVVDNFLGLARITDGVSLNPKGMMLEAAIDQAQSDSVAFTFTFQRLKPGEMAKFETRYDVRDYVIGTEESVNKSFPKRSDSYTISGHVQAFDCAVLPNAESMSPRALRDMWEGRKPGYLGHRHVPASDSFTLD